MNPLTPVLAGFWPLLSEAHATGDSAGPVVPSGAKLPCARSLARFGSLPSPINRSTACASAPSKPSTTTRPASWAAGRGPAAEASSRASSARSQRWIMVGVVGNPVSWIGSRSRTCRTRSASRPNMPEGSGDRTGQSMRSAAPLLLVLLGLCLLGLWFWLPRRASSGPPAPPEKPAEPLVVPGEQLIETRAPGSGGATRSALDPKQVAAAYSFHGQGTIRGP